MSQADLIFVHAPAVFDFRKRTIMTGPVSDMVPSTPIFEMYPLGLTTIGEYLERHGLVVRLFNLAGKMLFKKNFDVEKALSALDSPLFGIDLHWMPHCQGAIEVARIVKRLHPGSYIEMGGLSASVFHRELIEYDCVDFVMRGDSTEEPMRMLAERIRTSRQTHTPLGDLSDIPNLTWKDGAGVVRVNPLSWVPDDFNAVSLDYSYPMKGVLRDRDMLSYVPFKGWLRYPVCADLVCRGCNRSCPTCGGSSYAFRKHFGRRQPAWRDPKLLARDIANVQKHIWGPIFVLNDPLQAGEDYAEEFVCALKGKLKNPIGFEFFGPPSQDSRIYDLFDANLGDWSVEISAESHDDSVRASFGKGHYKTEELEQSIKDALAHKNCSRFDLYFMTGIPGQTEKSVLETGEYVRHLYEMVGYDRRLVVMTSPMAPFLDVGSFAFDHPGECGYRLKATTLEEHRERMLMPSWKHILNYESKSLGTDEMCESTYQAALDINRVKGEGGIIDKGQMLETEERIIAARDSMRMLDEILTAPHSPSDEALLEMRLRMERLNENTVANKSDLDWPHSAKPSHFANLGKLFARQAAANTRAAVTSRPNFASSDYPYPEQRNGCESPVFKASYNGEAMRAEGAASNVAGSAASSAAGEGCARKGELGQGREWELPQGSVSVDTATGLALDAEVSETRVRSIFSKIAKRYDLFNTISSIGQCNLWLAEVVAAASIAPDEALLDLAAGTGDVAFAICRKTPPAVAVVTDFSPQMLDIARQRYRMGISRHVPCHFMEVDAQATPFSDAVFDVVTCAYGVRNMPKREQALREAYRLLRPGGRYVVLEFGTPSRPGWRKLYHAYLNKAVPAIGGLITGEREGFEYLRDSILAFPGQETFAGMLYDAGFCEVRYRNCSGGIAVVYLAQK